MAKWIFNRNGQAAAIDCGDAIYNRNGSFRLGDQGTVHG